MLGVEPRGTRKAERSWEAFLEDIRCEVPGMLDSEAMIAADAVLTAQTRHVSAGEFEDYRGTPLPRVRNLCP